MSSGIPDVLAAIDIGTNSVHMVVARVSGNGRFEVLTREKDLVRLGSSGGDMKLLTDDAIERGVKALDHCRRIAENWDAPIVAVATSAVREAENRQVFIDRARDEAGIEVEVISGVEEARLIHLGILQSLAVFDRTILCCDIGGGSTELLFGLGEDVLASRSLKLGAIRLTRRFIPEGIAGTADVVACRQHLRDALAPVVAETRTLTAETFVGSSGTIETVVRMALAARSKDLPRNLNAAEVTIDEVEAVVERVLAAESLTDIRSIRGVDPSRADILAGGSLILLETMHAFAAGSVVFSDAALREGVLLDSLRRHSGEQAHLSDIRRQGVLHLMELCEEDPDHAAQVAWLSSRLFAGLAETLGLTPEAGELLEAAALLCNTGLFISHSRHHQHSYYVIRNSEHLTGFTDREIEMVALVARYHRKSAPNADRHASYGALSAADRATVASLAGIVRVAVGLDRSHSERVQDVRVGVEHDVVRIDVTPAEDASVELEVAAAQERADLLQERVGRPVVVAGPVPISTTD